jgi:hypothetical protein
MEVDGFHRSGLAPCWAAWSNSRLNHKTRLIHGEGVSALQATSPTRSSRGQIASVTEWLLGRLRRDTMRKAQA